MKCIAILARILVLLMLWCQNVQSVEFAPIVQLKAGQVRGIVEEIEHHKVWAYIGIRYGQARRFSKPQPADPWTDVYNATSHRFSCPQSRYPVHDKLDHASGLTAHYSNEDCLYLNVWQPSHSSKNGSRSVMYWIHGGGFSGGTAFEEIYNAKYIAAAGDVIVVSVNYRLGALGFLYGDTENAPGNLGLRDQILGLKWVQENIHAFGGNPNSVTIFGESAGSMSVGALILSPMAKGLFVHAILQSGAPNAYLGSISKAKARNNTLALTSRFNCSESSMSGLIHCLQSKSVEDILKNTDHALFDGESYLPVYGEGDEVLPLSPVEALKTGQFNKEISVLYGVNSGEGSGFIAGYLPTYFGKHADPNVMTRDVTNKLVAFLFQLFHENYYQEVADFYTRELTNDTSKDDLRRVVSNSFGDYHLTCPTILFMQEYAKHTDKVHFYSYRLTHQTKIGCQGWQDVCHSEDCRYMFGQPVKQPALYSDEDRKLARDMVRAWTNFAKLGHPGQMGNVEWKEAFTSGNYYTQFMTLDPSNYTMVSNFYKTTCDKFWAPKIFA